LVTIAVGLGISRVGRGRSVMAVLLLILGILVAASGVVAIGFGIPLNEFTLGTTLISGGATALTGGLILIGISAVVSELARLADGLGRVPTRASQRPGELVEPSPPTLPASRLSPPVAVPGPRPAASSAPTAPGPARAREVLPREARPTASHQPSPSSVDVSAAAIERLRSTIPRTDSPRVEPAPTAHAEETPLSPNGATAPYAPPPRTTAQPEVPEPRAGPEERAGGAVEALKASRLDFLFRSKPARPTLERESFETIWPTDTRGSGSGAPSGPEPTPSPAEVHVAPPVQEPPPAPTASESPPTATIVKSGVVDGMAYTLYADGSIEARLPQGTIRFGSVAELRAHIESNS
jgi:hypothetical protein